MAQSLSSFLSKRRWQDPLNRDVAGIRWETPHETALQTIKCGANFSGYYLASNIAYERLWKKIPGNKTEMHNKPFSLFHTEQPFIGHILVTEAKKQPRVVFWGHDLWARGLHSDPAFAMSYWLTLGNFLTSLSLGFHICKMRIIKELIVLIHRQSP